ncbi:hypothetical protein [Prevotella sp.]
MKTKVMKATNDLEEEYGRQRPFSVPEGYFSELSSRVMSELSAVTEQEREDRSAFKRGLRSYLRPMAAAAVTVGIVVVGFLAYHSLEGVQGARSLLGGRGVQDSFVLSESSGDAFDQAADYFMIDESDMYASLASE